MCGRRAGDAGRRGDGCAGCAGGGDCGAGRRQSPNRGARALRLNRWENRLEPTPSGNPQSATRLGLGSGKPWVRWDWKLTCSTQSALFRQSLKHGCFSCDAKHRGLTTDPAQVTWWRPTVCVQIRSTAPRRFARASAPSPTSHARFHDGLVRNKNGPVVRRAVCGAAHPQPRPCVRL